MLTAPASVLLACWLYSSVRCVCNGTGTTTEAIDVFAPVTTEGRIDNAVMSRGVIETIFVGDDPYMFLPVEKTKVPNLNCSSGFGASKRVQRVRALPRSKSIPAV